MQPVQATSQLQNEIWKAHQQAPRSPTGTAPRASSRVLQWLPPPDPSLQRRLLPCLSHHPSLSTRDLYSLRPASGLYTCSSLCLECYLSEYHRPQLNVILTVTSLTIPCDASPPLPPNRITSPLLTEHTSLSEMIPVIICWAISSLHS